MERALLNPSLSADTLKATQKAQFMHGILSFIMSKHMGQTITPELAATVIAQIMALAEPSTDIIPVQQMGELANTTSPEQFREGVLKLQDTMQGMDGHIECEVRHFFAPGLYAREMTIPKGTLIVGKIHKHAHLNIISQGQVRVATEFGQAYLSAPHTFVSEPGTKRAVYAMNDVIWTTMHVTDEADLEKIEAHVIAKSYAQYQAFKDTEQLKIEGVMP